VSCRPDQEAVATLWRRIDAAAAPRVVKLLPRFRFAQVAAYLWSKAHPQQAAQLFAGEVLAPLRTEALVALRSRRVAAEWLAQPKTAECQPKIRALRRQLIGLLDDILSHPPVPLKE
jgi:hypothetical protein